MRKWVVLCNWIKTIFQITREFENAVNLLMIFWDKLTVWHTLWKATTMLSLTLQVIEAYVLWILVSTCWDSVLYSLHMLILYQLKFWLMVARYGLLATTSKHSFWEPLVVKWVDVEFNYCTLNYLYALCSIHGYPWGRLEVLNLEPGKMLP